MTELKITLVLFGRYGMHSGMAENRWPCSSAIGSSRGSHPWRIYSCPLRNMSYSIVLIRRISKRSEEHTSELQSLMRISYAVFCLKKKIQKNATLKHKKTIHRHI